MSEEAKNNYTDIQHQLVYFGKYSFESIENLPLIEIDKYYKLFLAQKQREKEAADEAAKRAEAKRGR